MTQAIFGTVRNKNEREEALFLDEEKGSTIVRENLSSSLEKGFRSEQQQLQQQIYKDFSNVGQTVLYCKSN